MIAGLPYKLVLALSAALAAAGPTSIARPGETPSSRTAPGWQFAPDPLLGRLPTVGPRAKRLPAAVEVPGVAALPAHRMSAVSARLRTTPPAPLRICADPNNLPFSNARREGFENRIAELLGRALDRPVRYTWASDWHGLVRKTLGAHRCDVIMGLPAGGDRVLTTCAYYTSTYVFLSRRDRNLEISSFDDPALRRLRIGIHFVGDDYANPPPAHALGARHIVDNVRGYSLHGDAGRPNPSSNLIRAVAKQEVDVAVVWGPLAGYFATREGVPMRIVPVSPARDRTGLPFTFAISAGVRREDSTLRMRLDSALTARRAEIQHILSQYGIPLVATESEGRCGT